MQLIEKIEEMKNYRKRIKNKGKTIGFVPTLGYLHQGHISLIKRARENCDEVVVSIFVNPLQFGPKEDYQRYPRDLSRDAEICQKEGVDVIFAPSLKEMYPKGYSTFIDMQGNLIQVLEGKFRPGHFKGVTTVLIKLFNIVYPDLSFFGEKDYQQALIVKKMVKDLNLDTKIVLSPTVREKDGLALSSRNSYLTLKERKAASVLYRSLVKAKQAIEKGEKDPERVICLMEDLISKEPLAKIDYIDLVDPLTLERISQIKGDVLAVLAVRIGKVRLIDNMRV
ncbi:pantoate--beta-alanine ligase [Candidatus Aerophobetes bacterium]|nr:pantoate--beta-alanine ligase [Candidatus Aerophobetes bacterium]